MKTLKYLTAIILAIEIFGCNNQVDRIQILQKQIDSLQKKLDNAYKPGLGEFMSGIQMHHIKLWFAGQDQNWNLAQFEIDEIKESLTGIKKYCSDRPETQSIGMIEPALDSISNAIQRKDQVLFKTGYTLLTSTCNNCHQATKHEFNVIKIPDSPAFSDQEFKVKQ